jgi:hypothetical protein
MVVLAFKQLNIGINQTPQDEESHKWAHAVRTSLIGFLTCAFFLSRSYSPSLYLLFAFAAAAWMCTVLSIKDPVARKAAMSPVPWRAFTLKLAVFTIIVFKGIVTYKLMTVGRSV